MIEWRDEGICLSARAHGEGSAIVEAFTLTHGRHAGVVRGGAGRKMQPHLQPGAQLDLQWKARLESHIGAFTVEPIRSRAAQAMASRLGLAGLSAVAEVLHRVLPERDPHPRLFKATVSLLDHLGEPDIWPLLYLRWEVLLLEELGFGLDLSTCAVNGRANDLAFVSPKTGRAVSRGAAGEWADRLLPLVPCLRGEDGTLAEVAEALGVTGFFLAKHCFGESGKAETRERLIAILAAPKRI